MNMKIPLIILHLILLSHLTVFAQIDDMDHTAINRSRINRPVVKVGIGHIINFSEALLPVAVEYRFGKVVGAEMEIGVPLFFNTLIYRSSTGPVKDLDADIKFRGNLRFYVPSESENTVYIGIDGSLRNQKYQLKNGEYYDASGYLNTFSSAVVQKSVYTANVIVGMQANISRRLFAEIQAGLGYKGVAVERSNVSGNTRGQSPFNFRWQIPVGEGEDKIASKAGFINIPFALRICYRL